MLRRLDLRGADGDLAALVPVPDPPADAPVAAVQAILAEVRAGGDAAVRTLTERFDGVVLDHAAVAADEWKQALADTPPALRDALEAAAAAIEAYHRAQVAPELSHEAAPERAPERAHERAHERNGIVVRELRRPVGRAGLYVPGGRARYPSTVLMTAIPARVAGVDEVVLCAPPDRDGRVPSSTLAAAALAGVDEVYAIGGAQAVAAMAYGTETIRPVDVIVGPGNVYVALAKREVAGVVGVPSAFAGPSEVVVVADHTTPVDYAAIDIVVQAEHGPDGLAWLITWDDDVARSVTTAVARLVECSPRRDDIAATLERSGYAVVVDGPEQAMTVANVIAPEHLELMSADPEALLPLVANAGAVFCGPFAPAAVGDYLAGPSHVLPTNRTARFSSALRVDDFVKHVHVVSLDRDALARVAPHVAALAEAEGLPAHADAVLMRSGR